jgi:hypothetical protein
MKVICSVFKDKPCSFTGFVFEKHCRKAAKMVEILAALPNDKTRMVTPFIRR